MAKQAFHQTCVLLERSVNHPLSSTVSRVDNTISLVEKKPEVIDGLMGGLRETYGLSFKIIGAFSLAEYAKAAGVPDASREESKDIDIFLISNKQLSKEKITELKEAIGFKVDYTTHYHMDGYAEIKGYKINLDFTVGDGLDLSKKVKGQELHMQNISSLVMADKGTVINGVPLPSPEIMVLLKYRAYVDRSAQTNKDAVDLKFIFGYLLRTDPENFVNSSNISKIKEFFGGDRKAVKVFEKHLVEIVRGSA